MLYSQRDVRAVRVNTRTWADRRNSPAQAGGASCWEHGFQEIGGCGCMLRFRDETSRDGIYEVPKFALVLEVGWNYWWETAKGGMDSMVVRYVNFVWMISGFSCQSSMLTHICNIISFNHIEIFEPCRLSYLSECAQSRQNASSYPCRIFSLGGRKDLYPHVLHG